MRRIPLRGRYAVGKYAFAIVDDDMFEELSKFKWKAKPNGNKSHTYALRTTKLPDGRTVDIRMHRVVLGVPWDGIHDIDHKNRNSVDNRRLNLRLCTRSVNTLNTTDDVRQSWKDLIEIVQEHNKKYLCRPHFCWVSFGCCSWCDEPFRKRDARQLYCTDSCKQQTKRFKWEARGYRPPSAYKRKSDAEIVCKIITDDVSRGGSIQS